MPAAIGLSERLFSLGQPILLGELDADAERFFSIEVLVRGPVCGNGIRHVLAKRRSDPIDAGSCPIRGSVRPAR